MVNIDALEKYFLEIEELELLGMGLYTTPELMTYYAREKFMVTIALEFPECVEGLKLILRDNLTIIANLLKKTKHRYPATIEEILEFEEGMTLYEYIFQWSYYWNLTEKWMIENALIVICQWFNNIHSIEHNYWLDHPPRKVEVIARANKQRILMETDPEFPLPPGDYCPLVHKSRKDYLTKLSTYMDQVEYFYEKYGFIKTITKKEDPQKHFRWLIQYQLLNWDPDQIIEAMKDTHKKQESKITDPLEKKNHIKKLKKLEDKTTFSVKKEIKKIADIIELKIR